MIRKRIPKYDDHMIFRLIQRELLPYKRQFFPEASVTRNEMKVRLAKGATFVMKQRMRPSIDGFCHVIKRGRILWIDLLAVRSGSKGKGLGSALLGKAEKYGRLNRCDEIHLFVDENNGIAQRFYQKHGYTVFKYEPHIHCYLLVKK